MVLTDSVVFRFLTSDTFTGLLKPAVVIAVAAFLFYLEFKPRLKNSDLVEI